MNIAQTIPKTWVLATVGDVCCQTQYGYTTKASNRGDLRLLRTSDITSGSIDWETVPYCAENPDDLEKYIVKDGDILVSRAGSVGVSCLVTKPRKAVFASYLIRLKPFIDRRFLAYFLQSPEYWVTIADEKMGIAVPNVNAKKLKSISIPIPPAAEQRRIVAKIEELFSELDRGIESLITARAKLEVYRQAVLKHAFEGKLTAQWREENKNRLESAERFIAHMRTDRDLHHKTDLVEWKYDDRKWREAGYRLQGLSNTVAIGINHRDVAPRNWLWLRIEDVCDIVDGDRGQNYPKKVDYLPDGYCLFLNAKNVTTRGFVFDECQFISEEKHLSLRKGSVEIGDIIFTSRGTIGNVALHSSPLDFGAIRINSGMFILRNYSPILIGEYFTWLLLSPIIARQIKRLNSGTAQPQLPIREFKQFVIPVPPIPEQELILRTIEAQLSSIDAIEGDLSDQLNLGSVARQSILKNAFSGQLIAQDPNDEPASVFLDRINAEKAQTTKNGEDEEKTKKRNFA
ncbi:MAG: restriction endonuclease subunit S [Gemmatimonadota bacterium]|nr:restriction endonuclease subunit S [Gemmatimonadota bacterium]